MATTSSGDRPSQNAVNPTTSATSTTTSSWRRGLTACDGLELAHRRRGQDGVQQLVGAPPLRLDLGKVRRLAVVQALALQARADPRPQQHRG